MVNTVGEKGNEVAGHQSREHWGKEVQDCTEDRRMGKNVSVGKMSVCLHVCCPLSPTVLGSYPENQSGGGWKGPLGVTLAKPLLRVTWSPWQDHPQSGFESLISPKQLLAFVFMPLPGRAKSFRREISPERLCKTHWTTESPGCLS